MRHVRSLAIYHSGTAWLLALGLACGAGTSGPQPSTLHPHAIAVVSGHGQGASASAPLPSPIVFAVVDSTGRPLPGVAVAVRVASGGGWLTTPSAETDQAGRVSTTWYLGPWPDSLQALEARVVNLIAVANASVQRPAAAQRTFGSDSLIEWVAGDLPVVISAPHGGIVAPTTIPDRTVGTLTRDLNTDELARNVSDAFFDRFGRRPHVVISRISRRKLDANREIVEAAAGNATAERAWREYHGFIEASIVESRKANAQAFYIDLHGHGHEIQRLELGYLIPASKLELSDSLLNLDATVASASIWTLSQANGERFSNVLRGASSLGDYLERGGFPSVPSPATPSPGTAPYFEGGYSTERHARSDARVAGLQIEANLTGVRDTPASRSAFARTLAIAVDSFLIARGRPLR